MGKVVVADPDPAMGLDRSATRASASGMLGPLVATVSSSRTCTVCMLASRAAWYATCTARYRAVGAGANGRGTFSSSGSDRVGT